MIDPIDYPAHEELGLLTVTLPCGCLSPDDVGLDHNVDACVAAQSNIYEAMERGYE